MVDYLKNQLKIFTQWAWLRFLHHTFPQYWPDYLRSELTPPLLELVQSVRKSSAGFSAEHWDKLSSRCQGAGLLDFPVNDSISLVISTAYEIKAWGNLYRVYTLDAELLPSPTALDGRSCIDYPQLLREIDEVYALVQQARDEQIRRAQAAAEEKRLEAERQAWAAQEQAKGQVERTQFTLKINDLLGKLKAQGEECKRAVANIRSCADAVHTIDLEAKLLNNQIVALVSSAAPLIKKLEETDERLDMALSETISKSKSGEAPPTLSISENPLITFQEKYTSFYHRLSDIKEKIDKLRASRNNHQSKRSKISIDIENHKETIKLVRTQLKPHLVELRSILNRLKDDSNPKREWDRLEATVRKHNNNFQKTSSLLRSTKCWHLTKFNDSPEKRQLANDAEAAGNEVNSIQNHAFSFQANFVLPAPNLDYNL